eukprot:SAG22_NODE_6576_length_836_cov_1.284939_1_plen_146_part_10
MPMGPVLLRMPLSLLLLPLCAAAVLQLPPQPPEGCGGAAAHADTLGYLSHRRVAAVAAPDAPGCCARCLNASWCASWSYQHVWTPSTPCHLSPFAFEKLQHNSPGNSCGEAREPEPPPPPPAPVGPAGVYVVDTTPAGRRQVFEGV